MLIRQELVDFVKIVYCLLSFKVFRPWGHVRVYDVQAFVFVLVQSS